MKKPSAATVIATLALFVALGGTSYAAVALAPNSVGSVQIREGAVQSSDIKDGAIGSSDISNGAIDSTDIKSGSIQVSDLSSAAMKGLDGKDGAQGPAGPAGPAGPVGPAGPAGANGSGGGGTGGLKLLDGNSDEVTGIQTGIDPRFVLSGTLKMSPTAVNVLVGNSGVNQDGFVRYANNALWVMKRDGTYAPVGELRGYVFFKSADCTGPMYQPVYTTGPFVQTTLPGNGASPERVYYQQTGTETVTEGSSWSAYGSFGYPADCADAPVGTPLNYGGAPSAGTVLQKYETTTSGTFPTPPAASTPPFSWSAG